MHERNAVQDLLEEQVAGTTREPRVGVGKSVLNETTLICHNRLLGMALLQKLYNDACTTLEDMSSSI